MTRDRARARLAARRILRCAGHSVGLFAVMVGGLSLGVVLHARTPAMRRLAASIGNKVLADRFEGRIRVDNIEDLSLGTTGSVHARRVEITDSEGGRVILAEDVQASIDLYELT